jgi:isoleucyl-tRNA synthetase
MFKPVDPKVDILKLEQEQLEYWRLNRVFERTTEGREDAPEYVFYEGPPTANGKPGSHHVLARALQRYVPSLQSHERLLLRKTGWLGYTRSAR